jgi:hypothetical protein
MSARPWPSWVSAAGATDIDEEDEEDLAPQTPTATKTAAEEAPRTLLAAHPTVDVRHVEKAPVEDFDGLFAAAASLGDEEGWLKVGQGGRPGREPLPSLRQEALERSLAFKWWAWGRCFRCLKRRYQVSSCREPFRCIRYHRPGHQERFCRARFPDAHSCSPDTHAPCQRSRSPSALSSLVFPELG